MTFFGIRFLLLLSICAAFAGAASGQEAASDRGRELLQRHCAACHGIGASDQSRHPSAPPFRRLVKRYPAAMLAEALAEGLFTGHPDMPEFSFGPEEVGAVIAYLERLPKE